MKVAVAVLALCAAAAWAAPLGTSATDMNAGMPETGFFDSELMASHEGLDALPEPPKKDTPTGLHMHLQAAARLAQAGLHANPDGTEAGVMDKSPVHLFPPREEQAWRRRDAMSADGRDEMQPSDDEPLDDDCDSPQIGESEPYPQPAIVVDMNKPSNGDGLFFPEQDERTREVLEDSNRERRNHTRDHPSALAGRDNWHPSEFEQPVEKGQDKREDLPPPDAEDARRTKCSRSTNGHDVPDALDDLGEDCGMPEPEIPCETAGNSTRCAPHLTLLPPPPPPAEVMPPIPAPPQDKPCATWPVCPADVAVEITDYGVSRSVHVPDSSTTLQAILMATAEFGIKAEHIHTIRNAGAEVLGERLVRQLQDPQQLVVYLSCAARAASQQLIVKLPLCEELNVHRLQVRVEVPETDDVFTVDALSTDTLGYVLKQSPIPAKSVDKLTYNGARVDVDQTLEFLHFANKSALVVYLRPSPLPTWNASNSNNNNNGDSDGSDLLDGGDGSGRQPPAPIPVPNLNDDPNAWPRGPMTRPALVTIHIDGNTWQDFPMLLLPDNKGTAIFEALHDRTGRPRSAMHVKFHDLRIDDNTPLKPFGFIDGDIIPTQVAPAHPIMPPPQ